MGCRVSKKKPADPKKKVEAPAKAQADELTKSSKKSKKPGRNEVQKVKSKEANGPLIGEKPKSLERKSESNESKKAVPRKIIKNTPVPPRIHQNPQQPLSNQNAHPRKNQQQSNEEVDARAIKREVAAAAQVSQDSLENEAEEKKNFQPGIELAENDEIPEKLQKFHGGSVKRRSSPHNFKPEITRRHHHHRRNHHRHPRYRYNLPEMEEEDTLYEVGQVMPTVDFTKEYIESKSRSAEESRKAAAARANRTQAT